MSRDQAVQWRGVDDVRQTAPSHSLIGYWISLPYLSIVRHARPTVQTACLPTYTHALPAVFLYPLTDCGGVT
jgi:hypothetical protein